MLNKSLSSAAVSSDRTFGRRYSSTSARSRTADLRGPTPLNRFAEQWRGARWQKMALKVFKLPGGEGGLRKPYLMPTDAEVERFTTGLLALGLAEIDQLARAAGIG
jgi:hypothetical protein